VAGPYKLKLKKLEFLSAVDSPAQGDGARALLFKRKNGQKALKIRAKVAKTSDELGLVFGYAFASSLDGGKTPHVDYQDDAIDDDFLKAAMEFVEGGGATDVNHDGEQDGRIVFAWPLIPDVNKALGIDAKTVGLAVAIKPSAETYKRFKSGELTGFSIAGLGERTSLKRAAAAKTVTKRGDDVVFTDLVDGHQHAIDLDDPACSWMDILSTSYQTSEGAEQGHSHSWTYDPQTGAITIGADSGHSHTVDGVVPPEVLAAAAAIEAAEAARLAEVPAVLADNAAIPEPLPVEESSGAVISIAIAARNSTRSAPIGNPGLTSQEKPMPTEQDKQIADLTKRAERSERLAKLTDAHKAHLGRLSSEDGETFLAKSHAERDAVVAEIEKANEVVYTSKTDGTTYRKSDDARLVAQAKRLDAQSEELAIAKAGRETEVLKARAKAEIGHLAGDDETKVALLKAVGADEKIVAMLKAADAAVGELSLAKGYSPEGGADAANEPLAKFTAELAEYAKSKNKTVEAATAEFALTKRGGELYQVVENHRLTGHA
jgi:hypothetical protein